MGVINVGFGMAIAITEDHQALATTASEFLQKREVRRAARDLLEAETEPMPAMWDDIVNLGWLGLHIPPPKEAYSREWRERTYARIGEFLVANPAYHGAYGLAWVIDPAVAEISPHLAHVRELLHDGGAVMFPTDTADAATVENATSTSKTRRRLYEEGVYAPTDHALVWRRHDLIQWATTVTSDHA